MTRPSGIIVPAKERSARAAFDDLLDSEQAHRVTVNCIRIVKESFENDPKLAGAFREGQVAESAVKERFDICEEWVRKMRGDLHWPVKKIIDMLPRALRATLNGDDFVPPDRKGWRPNTKG
jgi:hypothetical protein